MPTPISRSLFADLGSFFSLFSTATTAYYSEGYWKEEEDKVEAIERDERLWERERERICFRCRNFGSVRGEQYVQITESKGSPISV